jgi:hypothetical protein
MAKKAFTGLSVLVAPSERPVDRVMHRTAADWLGHGDLGLADGAKHFHPTGVLANLRQRCVRCDTRLGARQTLRIIKPE